MIQKLTNKLNDRKNNKGFTLVELIVVIVILAILAAILIPGLLKWIDEAKDKQYQLEARSVYLATQAELTKKYGGTKPASLDDLDSTKINDLSGLSVESVTIDYKDSNSWDIKTFTTKFTSSDGTPVTMKWTAKDDDAGTTEKWERVTTP